MADKGNLDALSQILRVSSVEALSALSGYPDITIDETAEEVLVAGHWMTLILLSGTLLRITMKAQYMSESARHFASAVHGSKPAIDSESSSDFFKEFCNMTTGRVRSILSQNKIDVYVSLPIQLRGFDEIYFAQSKDAYVDSWKLKHDTFDIDCTTHVQLFGPLPSSNLEYHPVGSGRVEFL